MRFALIPIVLTGLALLCLPAGAGTAAAQTAPALTAAGTDAAQVTSFLKTLQAAVSVGNRLKVASLVHFPLKAVVEGEETVIQNESEFQAKYCRIFDAALKKAIADAKVETLAADQDGIAFDGGRVVFKPLADHKNALKIVAIGDLAQPR